MVGGPQAPRAAIVVIHGGSWRRGDKANINWRAICQWFASRRVRGRLGQLPPRAAVGVPGAARRRAGCRALAARPRHRRRATTSTPTGSGRSAASAGGNLAALLGTVGIRRLDQRRPRRRRRRPQRSRRSHHADRREHRCRSRLRAGAARVPRLHELRRLRERRSRASPAPTPTRPTRHSWSRTRLEEFIPLAQSERLVATLRDAGVDVDFVTVEGTSTRSRCSTTR